MEASVERRNYQRSCKQCCKAAISNDGNLWRDIDVYDISASGLSFKSTENFSKGAKVSLNLKVHCMLSEFNIKQKGSIVRNAVNGDENSFSVMFEEMDKNTQVQLDEILKSEIMVSKQKLIPDGDGGIYTFIMIPRTRSRKIRSFK